MKGNSSSAQAHQTNGNRKGANGKSADGSRGAARSNGNGPSPRNGNGNGKRHEPRPETLTGQPPITTLLGVRSEGKVLDKSELLAALVAFKKGDFSARLPVDLDGIDGKIADAFNDVIELNQRMSRELERLSRQDPAPD